MKSTTPISNLSLRPWVLLFLTVCTFFLPLGNRGLDEPDEGRYAEIGREMIETGDWLVPHFWYVPHLDKPPMTYWLVAASMKLFGQNEWAVRLPLALAALSGAWATWLLAGSLAGRRVAIWSVLILQSSMLYFAMARLLTTDLFLAQFSAWAIYFFWRSWVCLRIAVWNSPNSPPAAASPKYFWRWHLAGWLAVALGFLTKGPVALAIPLVTMLSIIIFRWRALTCKRLLFGGLLSGFILFIAVASPWFLAVNRRIPHTLDYMVFHQAAGHVLGTTIKSRRGFPFYFFVVVAIGLLPWSWLLGWLWRRSHWRRLSTMQRDGWIMLNVWALFTFTLFSLTHSKLAPYILPIFPALAAMLAMRFFRETETSEPGSPPAWIWLLCAASPLFFPAALPLGVAKLFHAAVPPWMNWQPALAFAVAVAIFALARKWNVARRASLAVAVAICSLWTIAGEVPRFDVDFKANQTLKPLGALLREQCHPGNAVLCWGQMPEGLPFYSQGVISATNRPYLGGMNLTRLPFEFPGNQERFGTLLLPTDESVIALLSGSRRVVVVIQERTGDRFRKAMGSAPLQPVGKSGQWELYSNR